MRLVNGILILLLFTACSDSSRRPDTSPPNVIAPGALSVVAASSTGISANDAAITSFLAAATATDNVAVVGTITNDAPTNFPIGVTQVTFAAMDAAGNTGSASASVTVAEPPDTTAPIVSAPSNLTLPATSDTGSLATEQALLDFLAAVTATDDVAVVGAITNNAAAEFLIGDTLVTFSATDDAGNIGIATSVVTITDASDPVISAPTIIQTPATTADGSLASNPDIADELAAVTATDNVAIVGGITNDAPSSFPYGETTVTFTAVDAAGNEGTATTVVHIVLPQTSHLFTATNGNNGLELWRTDGTDAGTLMVKDINASGDAAPENFLRIGNDFFFAANDGINGTELWKSDGSETGTVLVKDINLGVDSSSPDHLTEVQGKLFFSAEDALLGEELWVSDGTNAGTVLVKDIFTGSSSSEPYSLTAFGNTLLFAGTDGISGFELYKSDGTEVGTELVADINPGGSTSNSYPASLTIYKDALYFSASNTTQGRELWRTDGATTNTTLVTDIAAGATSSNPYEFTVLGDVDTGTLIFAASRSLAEGTELWQTDGTTAGTLLLKDIKPQVSTTSSNNGSRPRSFTIIGPTLYFSAQTQGRGGFQLYKSDGTTTGTTLVEDTTSGTTYSDIQIVGALGNRIYFDAEGGVTNRELWSSDGTNTGTSIVAEIDPNNTRSPRPASLATDQYSSVLGIPRPALLPVADSAGLLTIATSVNGLELWKTDGTEMNTVQIKDINPGAPDGLYRGRQ